MIKILTDVEIKDNLVKIRAEVWGDIRGGDFQLLATAHNILESIEEIVFHEEEAVVTAIAIHRAEQCGLDLEKRLRLHQEFWLPDCYGGEGEGKGEDD